MLIDRRRIAVALLAVVIGGATACGGAAPGDQAPGDQAPGDQPPSGDASQQPTEAGQAFPVTIEHKYGETVVTGEPQRVVSVGFSDQDTLLALGVIPVAVRDWYGDQPDAVWPWAQDELGDAEPEVLPSTDLDYEQIAALDPDLIIGLSSGMTQEQYSLLSKIAPTVAQSGDFVDYGMPWQDQVRFVGVAVGREAQADEVVRDTEALFAQARAEHPEFAGRTAAVAFTFQGTPGAYTSQDQRARIMTELGFVTPPEYDEIAGDQFFASFSGEQVDLLDTDVLVWVAGTDADLQAIRDLPLRPSLDAYSQGREVFLDPVLGGAFSFASPLSLPYLLDGLVPELAAAVDGDPASVVASATR